MKKPLRSSSHVHIETVRSAGQTSGNAAASSLRPVATSDANQPLVTAGAAHPRRIAVNATSREDALAQARQIAAASSRELQPVDFRQVVSKYIRETEKKLQALLDTAQQTGAILFFDEADALFGKRSGVQDAHDRYANLDTAYFRQQIEGYPGTVIVATTRPERLDPVLLKQHLFTEYRPHLTD